MTTYYGLSEETIESAREAAKRWVWCQGWSPSEGTFGRPMPQLGYAGELQYDLGKGCSGEFQHRDSGCKNVTEKPLTPAQIAKVAQAILAERIKRNNRDRPRQDFRERCLALARQQNAGRFTGMMLKIGNECFVFSFSGGHVLSNGNFAEVHASEREAVAASMKFSSFASASRSGITNP